MPTYETVFAIPANLGEEERKKSVKEAEKIVSSNGGKIVLSEEMGEREMAYKVKGNSRAYYYLLVFEAPAESFQAINDYYRFNDTYIRSLTLKKEQNKED